MNSKTKWRLGAAAVLGVLVALVIATTAAAQAAPTPGNPGAGVCPGPVMIGGGFGPGVAHEPIASALGITSQELWDARAAGKSVATLAQERNVDLATVVDTALAGHS